MGGQDFMSRAESARFRADLLFVILGSVPIACAYFIDLTKHPLGFDLCKDFGVVVVSLALVDLLWQLIAGGEPLTREIREMRELNALTRQAFRGGLIDLAEKRSRLLEENASFTEAVRTSGARIDMSGYTLHILVENQHLLETLLQRAKNNVKVRILLCGADNPSLRFHVQDSIYDGMKAELKTTWSILSKSRNTLSAADKANFEIKRLQRKSLNISIFRVDDRLSVVHYLQSTFTAGTPVYVVKGPDGLLFKAYVEEFEYLFALGEP